MGGGLRGDRQGLERGFPDPRPPLGHASSPCQAPTSSKWSQSPRVCSPWESAETEAGGWGRGWGLGPRPEPWVVKQSQDPVSPGA